MSHPQVSVVVPTMNRADDVVLCVKSILASDYPNLEVIVVDNASQDDTLLRLKNNFSNQKKVKTISLRENRGAGGGRNRGAKEANGKYILFVDNDNTIESSMISNLVDFMEKNPHSGLVGPLMLYQKNKELIWLYFADINMMTSQAKYQGTGEKVSKHKFSDPIRVGHLPNCFMVRRDDYREVGGFEEKYIVMYEEADFAEKIKRQLKKKIYLCPKAITYHNVPLPIENGKDDYLGFRSNERVYLTARNRVYFMKRNANTLQLLLFLIVFCPLISLYYCAQFIRMGQYRRAIIYLKGDLAGLFL